MDDSNLNPSEQDLVTLRDRHEDWLMSQPGVTGTGIGLDRGGQVVLRIFTSGISSQTRQCIASRLAEVPLAWEEGEITPE